MTNFVSKPLRKHATYKFQKLASRIVSIRKEKGNLSIGSPKKVKVRKFLETKFVWLKDFGIHRDHFRMEENPGDKILFQLIWAPYFIIKSVGIKLFQKTFLVAYILMLRLFLSLIRQSKPVPYQLKLLKTICKLFTLTH